MLATTQPAAIDAAREALRTILATCAAFSARPTSDSDLLKHIRTQPWGGHYTRAAGHAIGITQFGPTLYVGRSPAPWQRDADLVLSGPALLAELRALFTIPAAPDLPAHLPATSLPATPADTPRHLFGVYRHFLIPADAIPPALADLIAGTATQLPLPPDAPALPPEPTAPAQPITRPAPSQLALF